jgi:hypothetical protein
LERTRPADYARDPRTPVARIHVERDVQPPIRSVDAGLSGQSSQIVVAQSGAIRHFSDDCRRMKSCPFEYFTIW